MSFPWSALTIGAAALLAVAAAAEGADPAPSRLTVDYAGAALGIDDPAPRLGWQPVARRQVAYRIRVARSADALEADQLVWDSGRIASAANAQIPYAGPALAARSRYWWQVKTWDADGHESGWSRPAWWEMGLLAPADWSALWIAGPARRDNDWNDVRFTSDLTLTGTSIDLLFRARAAGKTYGEAYVWTLAEEKTGAVLIARVRHYPGGSSSGVKLTELKRVPLAGITLKGVRHRITITARGTSIATAIDGKQVDLTTDAAQTHGTIGFSSRDANAAKIHAVEVTGTGSPAFATRFAANDNPFVGGTVEADGLAVAAGVPNIDIVLPVESPAPLVRKDFTLPAKPIAAARLYVAGAGWPRLHLNGGTIGASAMASGFTAYDKRVLYQTYDVTDRVRAGRNALGAELGRGWYGLTDPNEWFQRGAVARRARAQGAARGHLRRRLAPDDRHRRELADNIRPDAQRFAPPRRAVRRTAAAGRLGHARFRGQRLGRGAAGRGADGRAAGRQCRADRTSRGGPPGLAQGSEARRLGL